LTSANKGGITNTEQRKGTTKNKSKAPNAPGSWHIKTWIGKKFTEKNGGMTYVDA